jgi:hypothetical protein
MEIPGQISLEIDTKLLMCGAEPFFKAKMNSWRERSN